MLQQPKTMDKNKKEYEDKKANNSFRNPQPIFREKDFSGKENIFVVAKTWGAAKNFFDATALQRFRKSKVQYINKEEQIEFKMNRENTIVVKLAGCLDVYENVEFLEIFKNKNIKIIDYRIVQPSLIN